MFTVSVRADEEVRLTLPLTGLTRPLRILADVEVRSGGDVEVSLTAGDSVVRRTLQQGTSSELSLDLQPSSDSVCARRHHARTAR